MATKFKVWIDNPSDIGGGNILDYATYSGDSQRQNGFQPGQVASSVRVNTALRSATLVVAALMSSLDPDGVYDAGSELSVVSQFVQQKWNSKANVYSPDLQGVPTAPTATDITNTQQIATTAFVHNVIDNATPKLARIVSGSYTGTGTYGQSNPVTISSSDLVIVPKLLIIDNCVYVWGNSSFTVGSGVNTYSQTVTTGETSVTKYSALVRRMVMQGSGTFLVKGSTLLTDLFGTTSFYGASTISNDELVNPTSITNHTTIGEFQGEAAGPYFQPASDYTGQTLENIFTISLSSGLDDLYLVTFVGSYAGDNATLALAINGEREEVADNTTGWKSDNKYYSDIETTTVTVSGISWYYGSATSGAQQLNANGVTYRWVAIS